MSKPSSLDLNTPFLSVKQVSEYLQLNEKKVYSLANEGHIPATKVTGKWMFPRELIDRWMLDSSHSGLLKDRLIIAGSDDPLLYRVVNTYAAQMGSHALVSYSPTGTGIGLKLLQSQRIDVCGMHWGPTAESRMRHPALLQQHAQYKNWVLIRAFQREQGLIVSPKLLQLSESPDAFFDTQYRWAMRQKGSGAQRFLLEILSHYHKTTDLLNCEVEANSEREAAAAIAMDMADIAPGARSVATEFGLGFISLGWESFDLALPRNIWFRHLFQEFINELKSLPSQQMAEALTGYDLTSCGELVWGDD
ncbi:helix-turn-helix transcriptional regulator [Cocleimonas flava]|jgi:excisionase family DNA binding protein|uniref:Excisionase family DNA binding protein n=1 Tax=Cocleimonas flava TaxID=634765 RepID=A0A4R1F5A2_9GAMM|nr:MULTISPECIES: helix-turn-helix transcriptional regulator [Cocleimonas]MEB8433114.1 helix-turn-helix transcriptional regulator [Cocleimonas sp. KMM 6892]MEC4715905.1 helix-turn-helix transcriptional regulator [Cocleimonas sp. KMM 6895]MEC4745366.1 helix-turn-helix transcriptional regulator [Cocleimonas sp. KMM 6896]TCJ87862.1 excisionase family DNA binding protein [Cocleimonas flava]